MENLSEVFPATQFIATSHSPLMAQAAENANFVLLNDREDEYGIEIVNNPEVVSGWRVDQILTSELFGGLGSRSATTEQLFLDRDALLSKPILSEEDEAELNRLRLEIENLPVDQFAGDRDSITMIRETAALLRRHQRGEE